QVNLSFRVGGRVAKVAFEEGDLVKAGDVVAMLDSVPLEDDARVARANVEQTSATLAKYEAGNRPQEIAVAKAAVAVREADLALAEKEFRRTQALLTDGAISKSEFDTAESRKKQAEANLTSARESLGLSSAGFREEDINAARASLHAAGAALMQVQTRLADTRLIAPSDGVLLTRVVEPGAMVTAGQTVATLSLTKTVWVRAYVNEKDLGRISPGMSAEIFTDTAPNKAYKGHIGFISPEAEFTPKSVETPELRTALVYRLRIIADDPDNGLRQGMPVTVKLHPQDGKDAAP
ncbi:TPA: secretion protein HlyD, partial [Candidatus Sumerlaeota bacterium]|nr:secretion protein HlyD [Candidatus Sumerlaeota bacterium]